MPVSGGHRQSAVMKFYQSQQQKEYLNKQLAAVTPTIEDVDEEMQFEERQSLFSMLRNTNTQGKASIKGANRGSRIVSIR